MNALYDKFIEEGVPGALQAGARIRGEFIMQSIQEALERIEGFVQWVASAASLGIDLGNLYIVISAHRDAPDGHLMTAIDVAEATPARCPMVDAGELELGDALRQVFSVCNKARLAPEYWQRDDGEVQYVGIAAAHIKWRMDADGIR